MKKFLFAILMVALTLVLIPGCKNEESVSQPELKVKWSYETGNAVWSSPAVANGKVFIGSYDKKVYALEEKTSDEEWEEKSEKERKQEREVWKFETGGCVESSPFVADGKIFIGSWDHKVYALDEETGNLIWSYKTGGEVCSSPMVANGTVFVGSNDHKVYALSEEDGKLIWEFETDDAVYSSPTVADGKVFIGSDDCKIYALDVNGTADGDQGLEDEDTEGGADVIWYFETGDCVECRPAVANGKVFVSSWDHKIYALDINGAADGDQGLKDKDKDVENGADVIWEYETGDEIWSSPVVVDSRVFIGSFDHKVYALDEESGEVIWSYKTDGEIYSSPAVSNGIVFIGSEDCKVYALDESSGEVKGVYKTETEGVIRSSPAVSEGVIFVGSFDGKVYALEM
jgi:outer membrane protein assembly factor BamB